MSDMKKLAEQNQEYMVRMRREFHSNPEPSMQETRTRDRIAEELTAMGLSPRVAGGTGVIAEIKGDLPGKTFGLRADIDALAVQQRNDVPYKSKTDGLMHACGHDAHAASLLGAAKLLIASKAEIKGTVRLLFQPGEELGLGALAMIKDGALDGLCGSMGLHMSSGLPVGKVSVEAGPRLAAASSFSYKITGKPGHGAMPHQGVDAGLAMAAAVLNLQSLVSREFSPLDPLVLTVGKMQSGTRFNVIASEATFEGTVRTFNPVTFKKMPEVMLRVISETAKAYRCEAEQLEVNELTLPTLNPKHTSALAVETVKQLFGEQALAEVGMSMGGEDYSFMMERLPDSCFGFVGSAGASADSRQPHHSGWFDIDEGALSVAACVYAQYAVNFLKQA